MPCVLGAGFAGPEEEGSVFYLFGEDAVRGGGGVGAGEEGGGDGGGFGGHCWDLCGALKL